MAINKPRHSNRSLAPQGGVLDLNVIRIRELLGWGWDKIAELYGADRSSIPGSSPGWEPLRAKGVPDPGLGASPVPDGIEIVR